MLHYHKNENERISGNDDGEHRLSGLSRQSLVRILIFVGCCLIFICSHFLQKPDQYKYTETTSWKDVYINVSITSSKKQDENSTNPIEGESVIEREKKIPPCLFYERHSIKLHLARQHKWLDSTGGCTASVCDRYSSHLQSGKHTLVGRFNMQARLSNHVFTHAWPK